jgi:hypothetical protein
MSPTPDTPTHRPVPVSRAEFARIVGRGRSTITEACSGPLAAAELPLRRIDLAHPAVVAWATARRIPLEQLGAGDLASKREDVAYTVSHAELAIIAGVTDDVLEMFALGPIAAARQADGTFILAHPAVLEMLAAFPFPRDENGIVEAAIPEGILRDAVDQAERIDLDHPSAQAFMARCLGHTPS